MRSKIYFLTGVCGVGKSTLIPYLKVLLPANTYDIRDFDERGVPDGADHLWRENEIKLWLEEGSTLAKDGISTVICGFAKKKDFAGLMSSDISEVELILLHADAETVRKRLVGRYTKNGVFDENQKVIGKPVTEFIAGNVWYSSKMREECEADGCEIIDTSRATPEEVARQVVALLSQDVDE